MKKLIALLLILVLGILIGCSTKETANKGTVMELKIGIMPDIDSIPLIIAERNGYFAEEGLKIELVQFKSAMERDAELQSGYIDGAISDLLAVCFAKDGGFEVKVTSATDGSYNLISNNQTVWHTVEDIRGRSIAISKNTIIEYVTDRVLEKNNMSDAAINKVIIPQIPARLEMLKTGEIDGATLPEPLASVAVHRGGNYITGSSAIDVNPGVMVFSSKVVDGNKEGILRLYQAYNKAIQYLNNTPKNEYIDFVVERSGFPNEAKESLKLPEYRKASLPKRSDVDEVVKWLLDKKLINNSYSYDDIIVKVVGE